MKELVFFTLMSLLVLACDNRPIPEEDRQYVFMQAMEGCGYYGKGVDLTVLRTKNLDILTNSLASSLDSLFGVGSVDMELRQAIRKELYEGLLMPRDDLTEQERAIDTSANTPSFDTVEFDTLKMIRNDGLFLNHRLNGENVWIEINPCIHKIIGEYQDVRVRYKKTEQKQVGAEIREYEVTNEKRYHVRAYIEFLISTDPMFGEREYYRVLVHDDAYFFTPIAWGQPDSFLSH